MKTRPNLAGRVALVVIIVLITIAWTGSSGWATVASGSTYKALLVADDGRVVVIECPVNGAWAQIHVADEKGTVVDKGRKIEGEPSFKLCAAKAGDLLRDRSMAKTYRALKSTESHKMDEVYEGHMSGSWSPRRTHYVMVSVTETTAHLTLVGASGELVREEVLTGEPDYGDTPFQLTTMWHPTGDLVVIVGRIHPASQEEGGDWVPFVRVWRIPVLDPRVVGRRYVDWARPFEKKCKGGDEDACEVAAQALAVSRSISQLPAQDE